MPKRISDVFNVEPTVLKKLNVFNGFINLDSKLYIDPRLLGKSSIPEFVNSDVEFNNFLADIINDMLILIELEKKSELENHYRQEFLIKQNKIKEKLKFPELPLAGLGYSNKNNEGKGIGDGIANDLLTNIKDFVKVGIVDPAIFQLADIFVDNIGADRISDMIIYILLPQLVKFTRRIAEQLNLPKSLSRIINNVDCFDLPYYSNKLILLVPEDILRLLPTPENGLKENYINDEIRFYLNLRMRKLFLTHSSKCSLKQVLLESPKMMTNMIKEYKSKLVIPYDFTKDPENLFNWHEVARFYSNHPEYPLNIKDEILINYPYNKKFLETIGVYFSQLVTKELYKEFYDEKGVAKKEKIGVDILLQILEYNLQDISSSVKYSHDDKAIKIGYYSIILKFTSTRGICQKFYQILKNTYFYPDNFRSNTSFTILLLIIVDGGKSQYEIEESYYKFVEKSGVEMINRVIENKFVKIFYIDARLNRT
ncbi:hypothetical protein [Microcoleus sp. MON2_D5]|uniref:hypothetical protein n=1 Tax=Microcoleus sp. MON2_D5 TaxID=2818833 RepID=UPI002FD41D15